MIFHFVMFLFIFLMLKMYETFAGLSRLELNTTFSDIFIFIIIKFILVLCKQIE